MRTSGVFAVADSRVSGDSSRGCLVNKAFSADDFPALHGRGWDISRRGVILGKGRIQPRVCPDGDSESFIDPERGEFLPAL